MTPLGSSLRRRTFLALPAVCVLFFAVTSLWNFLAERRWDRDHPVPGDFYSVEGKQAHLVCMGSGSPTVLLESAASARYTQWRKVQPDLSKITRVCSYDRAGHGWSQPRSGPRDAETIARELHSLLDHAGVVRPFIYAGESAGGLYVREYAREFPSEIAGVALIESSSPWQIDELPGFRASWEEDKHSFQRSLCIDRLKVWSGWERVFGRCRSQGGDVDCRPAYVDEDENELIYFETSSRQAGRLSSLGKIALLVITSKKETEDKVQGAVWNKEQESSKLLSPWGWRVIARESGHIVPIDRPDIVVSEMTRMISFLRGGRQPPFGSTTVN